MTAAREAQYPDPYAALGVRTFINCCGTRTIQDLRTKPRFQRVSASGMTESHPHDIEITKEAPNYRVNR